MLIVSVIASGPPLCDRQVSRALRTSSFRPLTVQQPGIYIRSATYVGPAPIEAFVPGTNPDDRL
jgi:hypothetical protein